MTVVSAFTRQAIRAYTTGNMHAVISVLRGSLGVLDPVTGLVGGLASTTTVYTGKARIRTVSGGTTVDLGGGEIAVRDTIISIPIDAPIPHRDDLIQILQDDDADPNLDTRIFRVLGADGGGFFGDARRMSCSGWYQSRYWGAQ